MTTTLATPILLGLGLLAAASPAAALVAGGGPARTDCFAAWQVTTPDVVPNRGKTGVDCEDGDAACDVDGAIDGVCTFGVSLCTGSDTERCTAAPVTAVTFNRRTARLGIAAPALPAVEPTCGPATLVPIALRQGRRRTRPSRKTKLVAKATTDAGRDRDVVRLRCVPNRGTGQCPENAAGGPRELAMAVAAAGTDLDNGVSGLSHSFPVPGGSMLRMCLTGCDPTTDSHCLQDEAATDVVQSRTFGPPLPLLSAGAPVCVVNRFGRPSLGGGSADLATGAVTGDLHLLSDVFLTTATQICPRCSANTVGRAGTCDSGRRAGQACRTESVLVASQGAGNRTYALSSDCPPAGIPTGTLDLTLPLGTGTSVLQGPNACGATQDDACGAGTCDAACTGPACVATTEDGQCIDAKGGLSQLCCSNQTATPCFPTGTGDGRLVRTGAAAPPLPAWPDPTYPKTGDATLVATFCEAATGSILVDAVAGLPGPGALVLPVTQTWVP